MTCFPTSSSPPRESEGLEPPESKPRCAGGISAKRTDVPPISGSFAAPARIPPPVPASRPHLHHGEFPEKEVIFPTALTRRGSAREGGGMQEPSNLVRRAVESLPECGRIPHVGPVREVGRPPLATGMWNAPDFWPGAVRTLPWPPACGILPHSGKERRPAAYPLPDASIAPPGGQEPALRLANAFTGGKS